VKHILILKKTQDPGAKSLEKLQVQKNLTTLTGLQRKTTESLNETKISRKKVQVQNHTQNTQNCVKSNTTKIWKLKYQN
jgi:hypothetical protein